MSNEYTFTTPVSTAFEMQRNAIEQSHQAVESGVEFQKRLNAAALDGVDTTENAQRSTVELTENAVHSYLDVVEATVPGAASVTAQVRENLDEQFDSLYQAHEEAFDVTEDEVAKGVDAYDELAVDYLATLNDGIEALLDAHEDVEAQTIEALEQFEAQFEEIQAQFEETGEEMQAQFEAQAEQFQEQFETQFEQFQAQLEELRAQFEEMQAHTVDIEA
jgi:DNA repair exonuclease SbcCD ATPase subunit